MQFIKENTYIYLTGSIVFLLGWSISENMKSSFSGDHIQCKCFSPGSPNGEENIFDLFESKCVCLYVKCLGLTGDQQDFSMIAPLPSVSIYILHKMYINFQHITALTLNTFIQLLSP